MELLPEVIKRKLSENPYGSHDGEGLDAPVLVKYFNPCGAGTWLITEGEEQNDGDWMLFGYCHIFEWEWGSIMLSELQDYRSPFGLGIERDLYASGTVRENVK